MKFFSAIALIAAVSAVKINRADNNSGPAGTIGNEGLNDPQATTFAPAGKVTTAAEKATKAAEAATKAANIHPGTTLTPYVAPVSNPIGK